MISEEQFKEWDKEAGIIMASYAKQHINTCTRCRIAGAEFPNNKAVFVLPEHFVDVLGLALSGTIVSMFQIAAKVDEIEAKLDER